MEVRFYTDPGHTHTTSHGCFEHGLSGLNEEEIVEAKKKDPHWFCLDAGEICGVAAYCNSQLPKDCDWGGCFAKDGQPLKEKTFCSYIYQADRKIDNHKFALRESHDRKLQTHKYTDPPWKATSSTGNSYNDRHKAYMDDIDDMIHTPGMSIAGIAAYAVAAKPTLPKSSDIQSSAGLECLEYGVWFIIALLVLSSL